MKRFLYMLFAIALLIIVITFTVQNPDDIEIQYYFGINWHGPLAIIIVLSLVAGILIGVLGGFAKNLQLRMKYARLIKEHDRSPPAKAGVDKAVETPKSLR